MFKKFLPILIAASLLLGVIGATSAWPLPRHESATGCNEKRDLGFGMQGFWSHNPISRMTLLSIATMVPVL